MDELNDRPFLLFLANLVDDELEALYDSQSSTLAIFRMLTPNAQQCVLRLLFKEENDWKRWCKPKHLYTVLNALKFLLKLRIVEGSLDGTIALNEVFRVNYLRSVMNGAFGSSGLILVETDDKIKKAANKDLYKKALERWECILRYLAMPSDSSDKGVGAMTQMLFQHIGFTKDGGGELEITSLGFQFLLLNRVEQIWTYILYYLRYIQEKSENIIPVLEFLLKLTLCASPVEAPKKDGESSVLPPAFKIDSRWPDLVQNFLLHLREMGVVFIRKRKDGFFFLTPLLSHLAESSCTKDSAALDHQRDKGFLIVETNYRVYSYTNSVLQLAVLSTFTEILYRFEDMSVGVITRDSVRKALQAGITADQIVLYLRANAHPETVSYHGAKNCIPITIVDQLHLWEAERKRLVCEDATLYSTFDTEDEYVNVKKFAVDQNIMLWNNDQTKLVIVKEEGHSMVKAWWKSNK